MSDGVPVGQRFSQVYLPRGLPLQDSQRMRYRLGMLYRTTRKYSSIAATIESELGVSVRRYGGDGGSDIPEFLKSAELRDVLDTITLAYWNAFDILPESKEAWKSGITRIFKEENVRYRLDTQCGVHLAIDSEYECSTASAVTGLGASRYTAAKHAFEAAQSAQDRAEPDFKEALRNVFEAVEVVFKLILPEAKRISGRDIGEKLKPLMATVYPDSPTAVTVAGQYLDSLCAWVNSVHNYRHGQPLEEAPQPPLDLSVALMSSGVAYLRWLIGIDQMLQVRAK